MRTWMQSDELTTLYYSSQILSLLQQQICSYSKGGDDMKNYGPLLREMRKGAGMSQEEVAHELYMSISNVSRLESGKYEIKLADALRWANVTGAQDVFVATLLSVDVAIVQQVIDAGMTIGTILGGIA